MTDHESRLSALESARRSSSDMHASTAAEVRALRELEQAHHDAATEARGSLTAKVEALEVFVEKLDVKLDELLAIEAKKAAAREAREALAKSVGAFFKVAGYVLGAATALFGFAKLVWELARHKP